MDYKFFYQQNIFLSPSYEEDRNTIAESFRILSESYNLRKVQDDDKSLLIENLLRFDLLKQFPSFHFIDALHVEGGPSKFQLILLGIDNNDATEEKNYEMKEQSQVEYQFVILSELKSQHGHVLMRPELLADKLSELLRKVEIDIKEEPEFSKNYFVLSDNEQKFRDNISRKMIHTIGKYKGLHIEIIDHKILIFIKRKLSKEAIVSLTGVANQILERE